eukprot:2747389-Lingulodinium_polyedra.AAC.1
MRANSQRSPMLTRGPNTCSRHGSLKRWPAERGPAWVRHLKSGAGRRAGATGGLAAAAATAAM